MKIIRSWQVNVFLNLFNYNYTVHFKNLKLLHMIRDPAEIQYSNVWQQASKLKGKQLKSSIPERTIIVVGPPSSGKTSFIKTYKSDLDFQTKPTNLIEYSYIKKAGVKKQTIHCYQIATKSLTDIISSLLTKDNFTEVILALCLDLSRPQKLVEQAYEWLGILKNQVQKFAQEKLINRQDKYAEYRQMLKDQYSENEDKSLIEPMPLQTFIIGTKYDIFQKYDTQNRKWLARALRYIAHQNNSSLYFCSTKNMQVGAQLRTYFQEKLQQDKKSKPHSQIDHTKPIFVNNGEDNIRSMNLPSSGSMNTKQILKKQLSSLFGQEQEKKKQQIDFSKYGQSRIDTVILQKKKQIQKIAKMLQASESRTSKRI